MEVINITELEKANKEKQVSDCETIVAILKKCRSMTHDLPVHTELSIMSITLIHRAIKELENHKQKIKGE